MANTFATKTEFRGKIRKTAARVCKEDNLTEKDAEEVYVAMCRILGISSNKEDD